MLEVIISPSENGGICLVVPACELPIEEIARRDLPAGTPYKIVPRDALPSDWSFFDSWEADFSSPDGFAIGLDAWNLEKGVVQ